MALTNFAALTSEELTVWSRDFWKAARNLSFINQFAGKGSNAMVQRVTELKKDEKQDAIDRATEIAKNKGTSLKIYKKDGTLQKEA